jgi:hypothetical protein
MWQRCYNDKHHKFARYGGRGITVCDRWSSFLTFISDMGPRPIGTSIDRINNDGNYEPSNCRWATPKEQAQNTSKNVLISFNGEICCASEWERRLGIGRCTIINRAKKGKDGFLLVKAKWLGSTTYMQK